MSKTIQLLQLMIDDNNKYAQSCLGAVMAAVSKDDEHN
jgi:hypothetical protein